MFCAPTLLIVGGCQFGGAELAMHSTVWPEGLIFEYYTVVLCSMTLAKIFVGRFVYSLQLLTIPWGDLQYCYSARDYKSGTVWTILGSPLRGYRRLERVHDTTTATPQYETSIPPQTLRI